MRWLCSRARRFANKLPSSVWLQGYNSSMAAKLGLAEYDRGIAGGLMRLMYEDSGELVWLSTIIRSGQWVRAAGPIGADLVRLTYKDSGKATEALVVVLV